MWINFSKPTGPVSDLTPERVAPTPSASGAHTRKHCNNTSTLKGVSWESRRQKWLVYIRGDGKRHFLGYFTDKFEAYFHYCMAAVLLHGAFAHA